MAQRRSPDGAVPSAEQGTAAACDDTRPLVHFTVPSGWVNDPLGLTFHGGRYHLFAQHVPGSVEWAMSCHWAHASSDDLLHWRPEPVALAPGDGDDGVWSGCVAVDDAGGSVAHLFYTSLVADDIQVGRIRVARPTSDDWVSWEKGPAVVEAAPDTGVTAFRDPYVFRDEDRWRMVIGGGLADGTAVAWTYTSQDLIDWADDGELARRSADDALEVPTGTVWECPQLFPLSGRWVLVVAASVPAVGEYTAYGVGDLVDGRFIAQSWSRLTYGPSYYASSSFTDRDGRRGLVYWLRGVRDSDGVWAGAVSVPHVVSLDGQRLVAAPHPGVSGGPVVGATTDGSAIDLPPAAWVEWQPTDHAAALWLEGGAGSALLALEVSDAGLVARVGDDRWEVPGPQGTVGVLVDRLVVEVFTSGGVLAVPVPTIPVPPDAASGSLPATGGARLVVRGGSASVRRVG